MKHAETVTFGGSGLDRDALLRSDTVAIENLFASDQAQVIVLWRGKLLLHSDTSELARLSSKHAVVREAVEGPIYLGRDMAPLFAVDISSWEPTVLDDKVSNTFLDTSEQQHPKADQSHVFVELRQVMTRLSRQDAELAVTARALFEWHKSHKFCSKCGQPSVMSMAGWQRSCPSCDAQHFPRTDPVVIMLITHGNNVLIGRSDFWPEGMYSLLAGFVEPGETLEAAVRREVKEETNIEVAEVGYLASQPWPFPNSLMFGCYGHATTTEITLDPNELEDARWMSREEMMAVHAGENPSIWAARKGSIAHFLIENWLADTLE